MGQSLEEVDAVGDAIRESRTPKGRTAGWVAASLAAVVVIAGVTWYVNRPTPPDESLFGPPVGNAYLMDYGVFGGSKDDLFEAVAAGPGGTALAIGSTLSTDGDFPSSRSRTEGGTGVLGTFANRTASVSSSDSATLRGLAVKPGGGFLVTGGSRPADVGMLWTYDSSGRLVGDVTLGSGPDHDVATPTVLTDGAIAMLGDGGPLVKRDMSGKLLWRQDVTPGDFGGYLTRMVATPDGGMVATGTSDGTGTKVSGTGPALLVKFGPGGELEWAKGFGGNGDWFYGLTVSPDGDIIVAGAAGWADDGFGATSGSGALLARFSPTGDMKWSRTVDMEGKDAIYNFFDVAVQGDRIVAAGGAWAHVGPDSSGVAIDYSRGLLASFDLDGTLLTAHVFGEGATGTLAFRSVAIAPDGDIYAVGETSVTAGEFRAVHGGIDALYVHLRLVAGPGFS